MSVAPLPIPVSYRRLFNVTEYHRMAEVGILQHDERVELIAGEIIPKWSDQPKRLFTVAEYYRMAEAGILKPKERVELIAGEILNMPSIGDAHSSFVISLTRWAYRLSEDELIVGAQTPIVLGVRDEPEPDLWLALFRADCYRSGKPTPAQLHLVIEVAESSLAYDRQIKAPRYAQASIREFWLVDVTAKSIHVFRDPADGHYRDVREYKTDESVAPLAFPEHSLSLRSLFPD